MNKNSFLTAMTALSFSLAIIGCSNDNLMEDGQGTTGKAIAFSGETAKITRATVDGAVAAALLGNQFNVLGTKTVNGNTSNVFEDVPVTYNNGWDYVTASEAIRYWDSNATQYLFWAYSDANSTKVVNSPTINSIKIKNATAEQLGKVYVTEKQTILPSLFDDHVKFNFKNAAAKVRLAFYNAIPEHHVTIEEFYSSDTDNTGSSSAILYSNNAFFSTATYDVQANGSLNRSSSSGETAVTSSNIVFGDGICNTGLTNDQIGNGIAEAVFDTPADAAHYVHPVPDQAKELKLRVKFHFRAGHGETHNRTTTVIIPAEFAKWESNHIYTYFFKITDNDLHPISFNAVVTTFDSKETITTIDGEKDVNITTYAEGSDVQDNQEYTINSTIFVGVTGYASISETNTDLGVSFAHTDDMEIDGSSAETITTGYTYLDQQSDGHYQFKATQAGKYIIRVKYKCSDTNHSAHTVYKVITVVDPAASTND